MKKVLLTGVAALFLATGTVHANEQLPDTMLGRWCEASIHGKVRKIFYHPSFVDTEHCPDFFDGITVSQNGFSDDRPIDHCDEYVFDKIERTQEGYLVSAHCEKAISGFNPEKDEDDLAGTWQLQIVNDELLIATRMPEG